MNSENRLTFRGAYILRAYHMKWKKYISLENVSLASKHCNVIMITLGTFIYYMGHPRDNKMFLSIANTC